MMASSNRVAIICMILAALAGCRGHSDRVAKLSDAPADRDAAAPDAGSRAAFCAGMEPQRLVAADGGERCLGDLFRDAVCSCTTISALGTFTSDSFDSSVSPYAPSIPPMAGAAIGVNGSFLGGGLYDIGGDLTVGGGFAAPVTVTIRGDLRVNGPVSLAGGLEVMGNAWLAGSLMAAGGWLLIDGDLTQAVGMERDVKSDSLMVKGRDLRDPVSVTQPCACGADEILDVARIVADAKTNSHDADARFDAGSLIGASADRRIELPCGKLWAKGLEASDGDHLTLELDGRTSLFLDGDLIVTGKLTFELGAAADVDVFVSGNYRISGTQDFDVTGAGNIRFYVAGDQRIDVKSAFQASLYAPHADVMLSGLGEMYGAVFANSLIAPGSVAVHYDRNIVRAGERCQTQP